MYRVGVVDGNMEIAVVKDCGGMAEDSEILERHVDPHLRVSVGEGEFGVDGLSIRRPRRIVERSRPVFTPCVMSGIEVLLGGLRVLAGQGIVLELCDELVQGGVSFL